MVLDQLCQWSSVSVLPTRSCSQVRLFPNDANAHRFAKLTLHASGHNSNESLRSAIQLHQTFSQTMPWSQIPPFSAFQMALVISYNILRSLWIKVVARWLHEGALRVNSRSHRNPATRLFKPAALFSFFDGAISLPQCSTIFTSRFEFFGVCHWTATTRMWDILDLCRGESGWVIYHNNLKLRHQAPTPDSVDPPRRLLCLL